MTTAFIPPHCPPGHEGTDQTGSKVQTSAKIYLSENNVMSWLLFMFHDLTDYSVAMHSQTCNLV